MPPVWMMRQAGRYLPEYRELREKAGGFLDLCFNPELAAEVTLQPIRRFGFDAAILFSDILVIPHALGRKVEFVAGEGPQLEPLADAAAIDAALRDAIDPSNGCAGLRDGAAGEARSSIRKTTLIGFCGAPWTVATYMVAGEARPTRRRRGCSPIAIRRLFAADRSAGRRPRSTIWSGSSRPAPMPCRFSIPGPACLPPEEFERWCIAADAADRRRRARAGAGRQDHRLSARRRRNGCRAMSSRPASTRVGLDWMFARDFARDMLQTACRGAGQSRSAGAARRRRRARPRGR